ncbi:hypothetical protein CLI70_07735 [Prevotella intermedia]|nr:hypothetical protein CLI70_07735 [Prevotella intermedia]
MFYQPNLPHSAALAHSFMVHKNLFLPYTTSQYFSFYRQKTDNKCVNIFHKHIYDVTNSLSVHCKTYCFAM